jgi:hypothetical protein
MKVKDWLKPNITPESVILGEQLNYVITIDNRIDTKLVSATGTIQVRVPYDRGNYFGSMALKKASSVETHKGVEGVLIGFLGLSGYERTSFAAYAPSKELGPIRIPVKIPVPDAEHRIRLGSMAGGTVSYKVVEPNELPVTVNAVLADDLETDDWSKVSTSFHEQLYLAFKIRSFVRSNLGTTRLEYLGLEWPYAEPLLPTAMGDQESHWYYNPETKRMEARNVDLTWNSDAGLYEATLYLDLHRPAERFPAVRGDLFLRIDEPLSGLTIQWLDHTGKKRQDVMVNGKTTIAARIERINLRDAFHRRTFSPRRRLHFKGVLADLNRLRDVENILNDVGLTICRTSYGSAPENTDLSQGCWIEATRRAIGGHRLRIRVCMSGTLLDPKQFPVIQPVTYVELLGRMMEDSSGVNAILNQIQMYLERRFASVRLDWGVSPVLSSDSAQQRSSSRARSFNE